MNIFVPSVMEEYNCTKTEADAVVIVVPTASSLMAGPIAAMFYQFAGARITIVSGALLCFLGFSVGSIAPSVPILSIFAVLIGMFASVLRYSHHVREILPDKCCNMYFLFRCLLFADAITKVHVAAVAPSS
ncbi:hypothetical protein ANCCAN_02858 [Ancylostoma caninum]|uniref:Uncharacterized protein n=1 Tax=Ancylostoma caninum TaxID=29170 RepID=A0A368H398_ANCCA|nr:hypothetical protein ANCCAN_02858 [Ancylostoma caninum]